MALEVESLVAIPARIGVDLRQVDHIRAGFEIGNDIVLSDEQAEEGAEDLVDDI